MTAAIYYHPDGYVTQREKLMGRHVAGDSFLRGLAQHAKSRQWWVLVENRDDVLPFRDLLRAMGKDETINILTRNRLGDLARPGALFYPGPNLGNLAARRAAHGHGQWSLCGITHTTSSAGAMDAITGLVTAPVQPWDALICTSRCVQDNVRRLLQAQVDNLKDRLGITRIVMPQMPVIPLGVHTAEFDFSDTDRVQARQFLAQLHPELGIDPDTVVVLFVGRLSFHAKAHPLAMYLALERAQQRTGKRVVLLECGWFPNDYIRNAFESAARLACPHVQRVVLDGRDASLRRHAWAGSDIFCSLSDNIQETFGIVPVEAMAAGLPNVVADWDGYKDTVRHGVDGFRIPTTLPEAGMGNDLAYRHALEIDTYDRYCGYACTVTAVDVEVAAEALRQLFEAPELRRRMGEAGRQRARDEFDWKVIIPRYEALWESLGALRREQAPQTQASAQAWPARMDPFHLFASYPTRHLTPQTHLGLCEGDVADALRRVAELRGLDMVKFADLVLPEPAEMTQLLEGFGGATGPVAAAQLVAEFAAPRQQFMLRSLAWLLKCGIVRVVPE